MGRATNNASISEVPVHNTTCRFVVTAKGRDQFEELNSNNVTCRSPGKCNFMYGFFRTHVY